jgi:hypothetical protein
MELIDGSILLGAFVRRAIWYQGIWAVPFAFWKAARRSRFSRIRRTMLEHFRCPHCGYDIRGLPTASEDGATICPECGCAWSLAPVEADDVPGEAPAVRNPIGVSEGDG